MGLWSTFWWLLRVCKWCPSVELSKHHVMKMWGGGASGDTAPPILTSRLDGSGQFHASAAIPLGKSNRYPLYGRQPVNERCVLSQTVRLFFDFAFERVLSRPMWTRTSVQNYQCSWDSTDYVICRWDCQTRNARICWLTVIHSALGQMSGGLHTSFLAFKPTTCCGCGTLDWYVTNSLRNSAHCFSYAL
jgi:hypothetical protein